jgi:hypothetical protein
VSAVSECVSRLPERFWATLATCLVRVEQDRASGDIEVTLAAHRGVIVRADIRAPAEVVTRRTEA